MSGKLLGVDYGSVRIGLALSDPDRKFAFPHDVYARRGDGPDEAFFKRLIAEEKVTGLVVGLPVHNDGREGDKAREVRRFSAWLGRVTGLGVVHYDERFTTVLAEGLLWEAGLSHQKRRERRDKVAAQILLQAYLDAGCPPEAAAGALDGEAK